MQMRVRLWFLALFLLGATSVQADIQLFGPDSLKQIERQHAGASFLMVLWSLDCAPCRTELELLGALRALHPGMKLVLVATDHVRNQDVLTAVLAEYSLDSVDNWAYAEESGERLRYAIDPAWYGEMPRSYFYQADLRRTATSGKLDRAKLDRWLLENH